MQEYQYARPAWLENEPYGIDAKPETRAEGGKQLLSMLQRFLAEWFKLAWHRKIKLVSGYALVVAKAGLRIHPVEGEGWNLNSQSHDTKLSATHISMPQLATFVARHLNRWSTKPT